MDTAIGHRLFTSLMFALALLVLLPLRLAAGWLGMDDAGLTAREVRGSVWSGRLSEARISSAQLGDLRAGLDPVPLLTGRARVSLERRGDDGDALKGAISISRHETGFDNVTARLPLGRVLAPLPVVAIELNDSSARFRDGLCLSAEGSARATIDGEMAGALFDGGLGGGLSGNARCDGGALLLPLVSQSGLARVVVRLSGGRHYRADLLVRGPAVARDRLLAAGFAPRADGYGLSVEGVF
jgi:general secretion pathway protein N